MAAGEDELEALVGKGGGVHGILRCLGHLEQPGLGGERAIAADAIDRPVARRRQQPGAGAGGDAVSRPALGRDREGLLSGLLGELEAAEEADQVGEDSAPFVSKDLVENR
jgi:hypothetical protein